MNLSMSNPKPHGIQVTLLVTWIAMSLPLRDVCLMLNFRIRHTLIKTSLEINSLGNGKKHMGQRPHGYIQSSKAMLSHLPLREVGLMVTQKIIRNLRFRFGFSF